MCGWMCENLVFCGSTGGRRWFGVELDDVSESAVGSEVFLGGKHRGTCDGRSFGACKMGHNGDIFVGVAFIINPRISHNFLCDGAQKLLFEFIGNV